MRTPPLVAFLLFLLLSAALARAADPVLVVYSNNRLLPANLEIDRGMREAFAATPEHPVELFVEFLDTPAFTGPDYERVVATYLREKYSARTPKVVVVAGQFAFDFMARNAELFPGVPLLHVAIDRTLLAQRQALPPNMIGTPMDYDYAGTIRLALRLHPHARRLVVVTGASSRDLEWARDTRLALSQVAGLPAVEFIEGLPSARVRERVAALGPNDVVFTPGYFRDGADAPFAPREAAELIALASAAPVYGPYSTFIGSGVVGGSMPTYVEIGRQGATTVNKLLQGTPISRLEVPASLPAVVQLDWRQVRRWDIDPSAIPGGALIHFRQPTFWEAYRTQALVIALVIAIQGAFIVALLVQRRARQRATAALSASEARLGLAARAARLSHWTWEVEAEAAEPALRAGAVTPLAQVLEGVHPADRDALARAARRAVRDGGELDIEYRAAGPGGETRWFAARGRRENGAAGQLVGVTLDITERKAALIQAESDRLALKHLTRVATLGELSASIAHQLNQPLAAILGNAEVMGKMLTLERPDRAELREICADIVAEDKRASEIIRRMSALYRRGELRVTSFDLNALVMETVALLRSELISRQVVVVTDFAPSLPAVEGERVQLQQVLLNLVLNAADAMGGLDPSERIATIRTERDGPLVRLSVTDRGTGIAPEHMRRVFEAFWSTKPDGLGMGLAICQSILKSHRGTLVASNKEGGGAAFVASWPLSQAQ